MRELEIIKYTICVFLGVVFISFILYKTITLFIYLNKKIKVDYSIKAKKEYREGMSGEYVIYVKTKIFDKWHQKQTYADYDLAIKEAEKLKKQLNLSKYF